MGERSSRLAEPQPMLSRRFARLHLEPLEGRELPGAVSVSPPASAAHTATTSTTTTLRTAAVAPANAQHYSHIRVAMLAYSGTPIGTFENKLLRESVDLVVPNVALLGRFDAIAPGTPKLIYTNVSNIYLDLYTDWLRFADRRGYDRERAFYHVTQRTAFTGDSGSSKPVNWFWSIQRGSDAAGWTDLTTVTKRSNPAVAFAPAGQAVAIGYPEKFREMNVALRSGPAGGWSATLEYASAVDAFGRATQWKPLPRLSDTTSGLNRTGTVTFDPPADWKAASVGGSDRLYFVRYRTTAAGTPPVAASVLGRDYVAAHGRAAGTIPAFDAAADRNRDGYLDNAEYARRRPGADARFAYESRLFYPAYGQMRFATNPGDGAFRNWAADYGRRFLAAHPTADGLFLDNSYGRLQADPRILRESTANYAADYGSLAGHINAAIGPKWVLANTAGSGASALPLAANGVSSIEEFGLRPLAHNFQHFEDVAAQTAERLRLMGPNGYAVLDTYPGGGSPTDPRTQIAALAYYYMLADPKRTFVMFNGGFEPSSSWSRHWTDAVKYDVGKPRGTWSEFARGQDPTNRTLAYRIYQRPYDRALVLYKPLSYANGKTGTPTTWTATTHKLNGRFRELHADGTLGPVVTQVRLRNGEGAILIRA